VPKELRSPGYFGWSPGCRSPAAEQCDVKQDVHVAPHIEVERALIRPGPDFLVSEKPDSFPGCDMLPSSEMCAPLVDHHHRCQCDRERSSRRESVGSISHAKAMSLDVPEDLEQLLASERRARVREKQQRGICGHKCLTLASHARSGTRPR